MTGIRRSWIAALLLWVTTPALSHVVLDSPNGGEVFETGSTLTITWTILVEHDLENWDIWYSVDGNEGPWVPIVIDLAPGDPAPGSIHTYDWLIPDGAASATAFIRIRMDIVDTELLMDVSDGAFSVQPPGQEFLRGDANGDQVVNIADPIGVLGFLFGTDSPGANALPCSEAADGNDDGELNVADPIFVLAYLFSSGSPAPPAPFPDCDSVPIATSLGCVQGTCTP